MIVHAHLRQASTGRREAPEPEIRHIQVEANTYEDGCDHIRAGLPEGWIVASWRVDR